MSARRRIGMFISFTGLVLLAASGWLWRGDASRRAEIRAEKAVLEDSVARVHDRLVQTNLKYRAFQESLPEMPDSVQRYGGVQVMEIGSGYFKTIRTLEIRERDIKLEIKALERESTREREQARERAVPVAAAGGAAAIVGVFLMLSGRRVGA